MLLLSLFLTKKELPFHTLCGPKVILASQAETFRIFSDLCLSLNSHIHVIVGSYGLSL